MEPLHLLAILINVRYNVHMNTKTTISISEARKNIFKIAEKVQKPGVYFTFTEKGKPKGVIMSAEEFESWTETMEVLQQFPNLDKDVAAADEAIRTGAYKNYPTLDDLKKDWGFKVSKKVSKKNAISTVSKTKSKKKSSKHISKR